MSVEDVKKQIEQRTGIPASLLTGGTVDEVIDRAHALLAYRRQSAGLPPKSARQQFAEWATAQAGDLDGIIDGMDPGAAGSGYLSYRDAGEVQGLPDPRPASEKFAEWFGQQMAWDPKEEDGCKDLF